MGGTGDRAIRSWLVTDKSSFVGTNKLYCFSNVPSDAERSFATSVEHVLIKSRLSIGHTHNYILHGRCVTKRVSAISRQYHLELCTRAIGVIEPISDHSIKRVWRFLLTNEPRNLFSNKQQIECFNPPF